MIRAFFIIVALVVTALIAVSLIDVSPLLRKGLASFGITPGEGLAWSKSRLVINLREAGLEIQDLAVRQSGSNAAPLLSVERCRITFDWPRFIWGKSLRIVEVRVVKPVLTYMKGSSGPGPKAVLMSALGRSKAQDSVVSQQAQTRAISEPPAAAASGSTGAVPDSSIKRWLKVQKQKISLRDVVVENLVIDRAKIMVGHSSEGAAGTSSIPRLDVHARNVKLGQSFPCSLDVAHRTEEPNIHATMRVKLDPADKSITVSGLHSLMELDGISFSRPVGFIDLSAYPWVSGGISGTFVLDIPGISYAPGKGLQMPEGKVAVLGAGMSWGWSGTALRIVKGKVSWAEGRIRVDDVLAVAADGTLNLNGSLRPNGSGAEFSLSFSLDNALLEKLADERAWPTILKGTVSGRGEFSGTVDGRGIWNENLTGFLDLTMDKGLLRDWNLSRLALRLTDPSGKRQIWRPNAPAALGRYMSPGDTTLQQAKLRLRTAGKNVFLENLSVLSDDTELRATGQWLNGGVKDLSVDVLFSKAASDALLRSAPALAGFTSAQGALRVPVAVEGRTNEIYCFLEESGERTFPSPATPCRELLSYVY